MKKILLALAAAALVAGCASGVKLDETPVSDATLKPVTAADANASGGANASGATKSAVEPVKLGDANKDMAGPGGVGRVVYFDYDSFIIKPDFQSLIESHARFIKAAPGRKVVVEGNTDERGGREYNLALGQKRAEAVRQALGLLGVGDNQVEAVSFGKEKPAEPGMSEEAFAKNRRAEIAYR
ncbi:MAG: peptidoglycan-associated lipoprotein Pal [Burkholderiaceae bacterium]|nr:peptidoglycan-associated lipoprotein Pal [Burkholderiaceae bacterium]